MAIKTLDDVINYTHMFDVKNFAFFSTDEYGITTITRTLYDQYINYIRPYIVTYQVAVNQRDFYSYKPKHLSQALYDTPELDWLIMKLNNVESASRFVVRRTIKIIPKSSLINIYNTLTTKSTDLLYQNRLANNIE